MSAFEDFVNLELPRRPTLLNYEITGYDGDPNGGGAPAIVQNSPKGTLFLQNTGFILWIKRSGTAATWSSLVTFAQVQSALGLASSPVDFNGQRLTSIASPTASTDAANKAYVDAVKQGLDVKASVRVATTANITLSGTQTIDGVAVIAGDRVLVKNQTTGSANGIYDVASGAWTRSADADVSSEVTSGLFTFVSEGVLASASGWILTTLDPITLGTTPLTFTQFSGAGQIVAGGGLTKTGNQLDVGANADGSIVVNADDIQVGVINDPQHGSRGGGTLHALVVAAGTAGFMSGSDKTKLDSVDLTLANATTAAITLYVDTAGNDGNPGTISFPFLTIQAAINSIPKNIKHPVTINVGAGSFAGYEVGNFSIWNAASPSSGAFLNIVGSISNATVATGTATGTATAGAIGSGITWGTLTDSGQTWTVNDLRGKFLEIISGTGSSQIAPIYSNTATTVTIVGIWATAPAAGSTYAIRDCSTIISSGVTAPAEISTILNSTNSATGTVGATNTSNSIWVHDVNSFGLGNSLGVVIQRMKTNATVLIVGQSAVAMKTCRFSGTSTGSNVKEGASLVVSGCVFDTSGNGLTVNGGLGGRTPGATIYRSLFLGNFIGLSATTVGTKVFGLYTAYVNATRAGCAAVSGGRVQLTIARIDGCFLGAGTNFNWTGGEAGFIILSTVDVSNSSVAGVSLIGLGAGYGNLTGVTGTGNAIGLSIEIGASVKIDSTSTLTGTTEVSLDGTATTLAAMRAASPKIVSNAYGSKFYE